MVAHLTSFANSPMMLDIASFTSSNIHYISIAMSLPLRYRFVIIRQSYGAVGLVVAVVLLAIFSLMR